MATTSRMTLSNREEQINQEWTDHWPLALLCAKRWVRHWLAVHDLDAQVSNVQDLAADTIDAAFEAYRNSFAERAPRIIPAAIRCWIRSAARNQVRRALRHHRHNLVQLHRMDNFPTNEDPADDAKPDDWLNAINLVTKADRRELLIAVAVGFSQGLSQREIAGEIGISHTHVQRMKNVLKELLALYHRTA